MTKIDGISAIAVVLIASFAVDRIVTGILFLLAYSASWKRRFPNPGSAPEGEPRDTAVRNLKLVYFCTAAALAIPLIAWVGKIRILYALGFPTNQYLDILITGLILVGGSDRVAELLKLGSPADVKSEPKPIAITGTLILEDRQGPALAASSGSQRA